MINSISQIERFEVTGIFDMDTENYGQIHRIQGIAIPKQLNVRKKEALEAKLFLFSNYFPFHSFTVGHSIC
jgi:hypothetical protein